jgi:hypothetical protein
MSLMVSLPKKRLRTDNGKLGFCGRNLHSERMAEIRVISQFFPNAFSSFAYSFFLVKACTNPHKAIFTVNNITV